MFIAIRVYCSPATSYPFIQEEAAWTNERPPALRSLAQPAIQQYEPNELFLVVAED